MMKQLAAATILLGMGSSGAFAAAFCDCCASPLSVSCAAACAAIAEPGGQCLVAVDVSGKERIGPDQNPLYSLKFGTLRLKDPSREEREALRRLLEKAREAAESDREKALADQKTGRIDSETAAQRARRYDDAMVNYYLGQQVYRSTARK